ncbi:hypothetical protein MMC29_001766 [Sticta canariensis]|nr:hypothetical protein [Sticta canariensis]
MHSAILGLMALSICVVDAFQDTSPFFLFSTSEIQASSPQIVPAASLSKTIISELRKCPSDTYVIVSQPGVNAADYHDRFSAPHMRQNIAGDNKNVRSTMTVSNVLGALDAESMSKEVQEKCGAEVLHVDASTGSFKVGKTAQPLIINLDFPVLPAERGRASKLLEHDAFLAFVLNLLPSPKYTVLYTTTPVSFEQLSTMAKAEDYQIETNFQSAMHMELKRDFSTHKRESNHSTTSRSAPLFEKYMFFGPGLFTGLLVTFLLLSILYVGISGVASLQVTYAAFDREMGPAASKKQTQ